MDQADQPELQQLGLTLTKVLDRHGYGLQYAAIKEAGEAFGTTRGRAFEVAELPVRVREGCESKIDFIFSHSNVYLVVECKRANPAVRNWNFIRAPYVRRNRSHEWFSVEKVAIDRAIADQGLPGQSVVATGGKLDFDMGEKAYHLAVETRSGETGDPGGPGRGAIEEACAQVCRGGSGLVELIASEPGLAPGSWHGTSVPRSAGIDVVAVIPLIVTTARIITTDVGLSQASLADGKLASNDQRINEEPWVFYQYHRSPGLRHSLSIGDDSTLAQYVPWPQYPFHGQDSLPELLDREYVRTIPVVNAKSFRRFLECFCWW